jgi:hypothetical protein
MFKFIFILSSVFESYKVSDFQREVKWVTKNLASDLQVTFKWEIFEVSDFFIPKSLRGLRQAN